MENEKEKIKVTEEDNIHDQWFEEAANQKRETYMDFFSHLMDDYEHDYGTVTHAVGACAVGAAWAACKIAGLTGFQASFVMWDFIRYWSFRTNKCGLRLLNWDDMLYPQSEYKFEKRIHPDIWKRIQDEAKK